MYVFLATCTAGVGNCGRSGTCEGGKCVCTNDWTGIQCEIPPEAPPVQDSIVGKPDRKISDADSTDLLVEEDSSINAGTVVGIIIGIAVFAIASLVFITKSSRQKQRAETTNAIGSMFRDDADPGAPFSENPMTPLESITTF